MLFKMIHVIVGGLVGGFILHPRYWLAALFGGVFFFGYEVWEGIRKKDKGWPEMREFSVGYVIGLIAEWFYRKEKEHEHEREDAGGTQSQQG